MNDVLMAKIKAGLKDDSKYLYQHLETYVLKQNELIAYYTNKLQEVLKKEELRKLMKEEK